MKAKPLLITLAAAGLFVVLFFAFGGGGKGGEFSGEKALAHATSIVGFGERTPGSEGIRKAQDYIEKALSEAGWTSVRQEFEADTVKGKLPFVNIRARFPEKGGDIDWTDGGGLTLVGSHYDTKFFDAFTFVGANDGGSSTGALLELARVLAGSPDLARRIELVFFDGEENIGGEYTATDGLFGSREYAKLWRAAPPERKPVRGFVLDMVGDPQLNVNPPQDSPRPLLLALYAAATDLGHRRYFGLNQTDILDDHVPLNQAGIPTLDIIDLDYPHWHQAGDTVDKLSARSLEIVGSVTFRVLERLLVDGK